MSNGSGKKKNSTTARTTTTASIPVVAEVVDYDWRDARRDQNNTQSNEEFITDIAGLTNEGLSIFNGDDQAVRDYFTVENLADTDFGFVAWTDYDEVEHEYRPTQRDFNEMADMVINNEWHIAEVVEAPTAPVYELGDAPKHIRFDLRAYNSRVFIADGFISDNHALVALPRLTNPQKTVKEFIAIGDGSWINKGMWSNSDIPPLTDHYNKVMNAERIEVVSAVRPATAVESQPFVNVKQVLTVGAGNQTFGFDAKYLAPLITAAGEGAQVAIHDNKFGVVRDHNNEFVGMVGKLVEF